MIHSHTLRVKYEEKKESPRNTTVQRARRINAGTNCTEALQPEAKRTRRKVAQLKLRHHDPFPSRPSVMLHATTTPRNFSPLKTQEKLTVDHHIGTLTIFFPRHDHAKYKRTKDSPPHQPHHVVTYSVGYKAVIAVCCSVTILWPTRLHV